MTSVPRGPCGVALPPAAAPLPPGAGVSPPPPAAPRPVALAFAPGARRFSTRWVELALNAKACTSCHDLIAPVDRLRSSTRVGGGGGVLPAPRPVWFAGCPVAGVCAGGCVGVGCVAGGVAG